MIEVSFKFTADRLIDGLQHFRRQGFARLTRSLVWVLGIMAIPIAYFGITSGEWVIACCLIVGLFSPLIVPVLSDWLIRRRFSKSPFSNEDMTLKFDEAGLHATSLTTDLNLAWTAFTKAVEFSDGFLLFNGPKLFRWIPADAFVNPNQIPDFKALLRAKVSQYERIEA